MSTTWQFKTDPFSSNKCRLLAFNGEDALLKGYYFDVLVVVSDLNEKDALQKLPDLMKANASLEGTRSKKENFSWQGMISQATYLFQEGGQAVFRLSLQPKSHRLALTEHSRIFMSMTIPQILNKLLKDEELTPGSDFDVGLKDKYATRPYTCQYSESTAHFIWRHLERMGAYTYIRQEKSGDVLVFADASAIPEKLPIENKLDWNKDNPDEVLTSFYQTKRATPTKVTLRDYSTEQPGTTAKTAQDTDDLFGGGEVNIYASQNIYAEVDSFSKDFIVEEANQSASKLAEARVRSLIASANQAFGKSTIPWLQVGYSVSINNEDYQLITLKHTCNLASDEMETRLLERASQAGFVINSAKGYNNEFYCHQQSLGAYAPPIQTVRPSISGVVHAKVDAAGAGDYAELDEHGRYKVEFFFPEKVVYSDSDNPADGNRSIPLRMAQPHAGEKSGIHFPLLKGVEVLVMFTDGDPDRPFILSAMPNPEHPSVIDDTTQESNKIATPGGNAITMLDSVGKREIKIEIAGGGYIRMAEGNPLNLK